MPGYLPTSYGDGIADVYDEWFGDVGDTPATVAFLDELATARHGAGAGPRAGGRHRPPRRPAVGRGHHVTGIDVSAAMLGRLAAADRRPRRHRPSWATWSTTYPSGPFDLVVRRLQLAVHAHRARRPAGVLRSRRRRARAGRSVRRRGVRAVGPAAVRVARRRALDARRTASCSPSSTPTRPRSRSTVSTSSSSTASRCGCGRARIRYTTPAELDEMGGGGRDAPRRAPRGRRPPPFTRPVAVPRQRLST